MVNLFTEVILIFSKQ